MASLRYLKATASTDEIIEALQVDAGVIVEDVLSHDMLSRIKSELSPYLAADAFGRDEFTGFRTKRIGALIARSQACGELALNPMATQAASAFLEPKTWLQRPQGIEIPAI